VRPEVLFPLFKTIESLRGVGPRVAVLIQKLAGPHVVDLCLHLPTGLIDRDYRPKVADVEAGRIATLTVETREHRPGDGRRPYRVVTGDETGEIDLVFFRARGDWLMKQLPVGETRVVSGAVERYQNRAQIPHPDYIAPIDDEDALPRHEPVYPLTAGLQPKTLAKAIQGALAAAPELPEWLDPALMKVHDWDS